MTLGKPWQVEGVLMEVRETARAAARRSGLSVGQWLNSRILDAAADEDAGCEAYMRGEEAGHLEGSLAGISKRLGELREGLDRVARGAPFMPGQSRRVGFGSGAGDWSGSTEDGRRITETISRIDQRLDGLIQECRAASNVSEEKIVSEPADLRPARAPDCDFSRLEDQLRYLTERIESLHDAAPINDEVAGLRNDLSNIGRRLSEAWPREAIRALEDEMRALAGRIDAWRKSGGEGSTLASVEYSLAEIRDALRNLEPAGNVKAFVGAIQELSHKIDQIDGAGQDPAVLQQLEAAISGLRSIIAHVGSGDALASLANEVRMLAERFDMALPTADRNADILLNLDQRIASIADAIAAVRAEGQGPQHVDAIVQSLGEKIERLQVSQQRDATLVRLEERLGKLADKLDASEARLGRLDSIERAMAELLRYVHEGRAKNALGGEQARHAAVPPPVQDRGPFAPQRSIHPLPADYPLEPGSGPPRPSGNAGGVECTAAPKAASEPGQPRSDARRNPNFILAARRAVRAAAEERISGRSRPASRVEPPSGRLAGTLGRHAKSLLLGISVMIVLVGALQVASHFKLAGVPIDLWRLKAPHSDAPTPSEIRPQSAAPGMSRYRRSQLIPVAAGPVQLASLREATIPQSESDRREPSPAGLIEWPVPKNTVAPGV